jgi:radical SAM superfamily enzyme YgiQ (UPF0313 family)
MAEAHRLRHAARLRGDAQHRQAPEILEKMREAFFVTVFCGIETPDPDALKAMHKDHNMMVPILEGIQTINPTAWRSSPASSWGSTPTSRNGDALLAFVEKSAIPLLTINLLQALPKTPLWDRLEREAGCPDDDGRDSNVDFLLPYDEVVESWRRCMEIAYEPEQAVRALPVSVRIHLRQRHQGAGRPS